MGGGTSGHLHLVIAARTTYLKGQLKRHFKGNVSVELRDLLENWSDGVWGKRSKDSAIADDALEARLAYISAHGVKEGLVETPGHWPGVQFVRAVTEGKPLKGVWYDRTKLDALTRKWERKPLDTRGPKPTLQDVAREMELKLDRLPQLEGLSEADHRAWWVDIVAAGVAAYPCETRMPPKGVERIMKQDPEARPRRPKRSPAPLIHTGSKERRKVFHANYRAYVEGFYRAQERLTAAIADACFPEEGCLPAGIPLAVDTR